MTSNALYIASLRRRGVSVRPSTGAGRVGLERLMTAMRGDDGFKTLAEYIASPHFRGAVAESQAPGRRKDWMHPADYLLPVSVHSIPVSDCEEMLRDFERNHDRGGPGARFTFAEALTYPENLWTTSLFFMFVGPDGSRAYNPHRHGVPNHTLMLQVRGYKHAVVWPNDESPNLYQITDLLPKANEIAEMPGKECRGNARCVFLWTDTEVDVFIDDSVHAYFLFLFLSLGLRL